MVPERTEREILIDAPLEVVWAVITQPDHQTDALFPIPLSVLEGRRWRVAARNLGGDPTDLRSFAYCS